VDHDDDFSPGATAHIDVSELIDDRSQDVVGWIVCLNGSQRGRDFRLVTGRNVIGTAADCDIVLTDPYLSSKHVVIRHENGEFMLIDLDSTNGSYVNDRQVTKQDLIDNDKVRIGRTEMKFKSLF
jgi:pSer/pThr/pTyr-binding forkhead associated (FHA) protein